MVWGRMVTKVRLPSSVGGRDICRPAQKGGTVESFFQWFLEDGGHGCTSDREDRESKK